MGNAPYLHLTFLVDASLGGGYCYKPIHYYETPTPNLYYWLNWTYV